MATTLRIGHAPAAVVPVGELGDHVARLLASRGVCEVAAAGELEACFAADPAAVIMTMWRQCPSLCDRADELAFRHGVPWLPVVLEHPRLRVGPWVEPPSGPCHQCYRQRRIQHDVQHATTGALETAYDRDPACGIRGYLPHHARVAAGITELMVRARLASHPSGPEPGAAGSLSAVNLLTWTTASHRVLARHGCPRCRPKDEIGSAGLSVLLATTGPGAGP